MLIQKLNNKNEFFLDFIYCRLANRFYNNGITPKIPHKIINQYFSMIFHFNKKQTRTVLKMMETANLIELQRGSGNGNYLIILKGVKNETKII